ncbi:hypothetical protein SISSUDRAFT_993980, partial [Sistotremastrum suecicum HHB10207 ss-3]
YMADKIGDMGDPWGIPLSTAFVSSRIPSRQIDAFLWLRNVDVHLMMSSGNRLSRIITSNLLWFTLSKKPVMSKVSTEVTHP